MNDKRKRYEAKENKEFWQRACKSTGMAPSIELTPARRMTILETYIKNLRALQQELWDSYSKQEGGLAFAYVYTDLREAVAQLAKLQLEQIAPKGG